MVSHIRYASPIGPLTVGWENGSIISVGPYRDGQSCDPPSAVSTQAVEQLDEYFRGCRTGFDLHIQLSGTAFQISVWNALRQIPYGETRTYREIAAAIGNPNAARAVGMACKKNPLWIVVPCHRVVGRNLALTGYAGGLSAKQFLLKLEQENR